MHAYPNTHTYVPCRRISEPTINTNPGIKLIMRIAVNQINFVME